MQSPWFLNVLPSARTLVVQRPSLHGSFVVGTFPPIQSPPGDAAMSQGLYVTFVLTLSPEPVPTGPGPLAAPHQLQVASRTPLWPFLTPKFALPVMLLKLTWMV